ncbi:hypothetical protein M409DRAFT_23273 [Zasmidium cellare ATCC 36951]|uniref:NmrA-like domain-containing protein n=1 Tax=Zasmidium cellare ATCC 36951 TaxID=1080233 RepID=A0A6A6CHZ4_ZASCE|nr:uncharacterized protein M409DRAFT_23273 [Zasmidium cellare ATCC 36951]KAF2166641.1 hypothetical protein M409DRAFT_23273 [Zasmidium cellare ATCC 36951]
MATEKKLLVVLAATGSQGSAVINHFLEHEPSYRIRGTTRNVDSAKAKSLSAKGIGMVQAELTDIDSLIAAFQGASAIYAYTDSAGAVQAKEAIEAWESGKEKSLPDAAGALEVRQGENVADAAAQIPTLEKLIWSSTPDSKTLAGCEYDNYEMASKAEVLRYMRSLPALKGKVNAVYLAVFTESFVRFPQVIGWTKPTGTDKKYTVRIPWNPASPIPWINLAQDAGSWVGALLRVDGDVTVEAVGGEMSTQDVVTIMGEKLDVEIEIQHISLEEYASVEPTGLMRHVGQLMKWTADLGIGREDASAIKAGESVKTHTSVKRSSIRESFEAIDWSNIL